MKRLSFVLFLLCAHAPLQASIQEYLDDLFEGSPSRGNHYQEKARELLEPLTDKNLKKLAIQTAKLVFPDSGNSRVDTLDYLLKEKSIHSISDFKNILFFLQEEKEDFYDLAILPRFEKLKDIFDRCLFHLEIKKKLAQSKSQIQDLLDQMNQDIGTDPNASYTVPAHEVIKVLEKGLEARQKHKKLLPYLPYDDENPPLPFFVKLANSFSEDSHPLKYTDKLPAWGLLATTYFKVALETFVTPQQFDETLNHFIPELERKIKEKKTSYAWFTLFTNRLSILMTHPKERNLFPGFNTRFDAYRAVLTQFQFNGEPGWYTYKGFKKACIDIGTKYTKEVLSPFALSKLYPDIVMLPYPFNLSAGDILQTMPRPGGSHLWPVGYALGNVWADGAVLSPSLFMEHDQGHLAEMIRDLSFASYGIVNNKLHYVPESEEAWHDTVMGRKLYYIALKRAQEIALSSTDDHQKIMNTFFGFYALHEMSAHLEGRIHFLTEGHSDYIKVPYDLLNNSHYYWGLLSDPLKKIAKEKDPDKFIKAYTASLNQFLKEFAEKDLGGFDKATLLYLKLKADPSRPANTIICPKDKQHLRFGFRYILSTELGFEPENMKTDVEGCLKLPQDKPRKKLLEDLDNLQSGTNLKRYYFLGSPFYQGDEPPEHGEETLAP